MRVQIDDLDKAVRKELENYSQEVGEVVDNAVLRVARRCLASIKAKSPDRSEAYKKGWAMAKETMRSRLLAVIYNRKRWFLIHLLENGHQKAGGGRVEGKPHVAPAEAQAERELVSELVRKLGG